MLQAVDAEMLEERIKILKEEVRKMLVPSSDEMVSTKIDYIDSIQRLGLSYHFEREVHDLLQQIHITYVRNGTIMITPNQDLRTLAILFRLLRQQGYRLSPGIYTHILNLNECLFGHIYKYICVCI